MNDPTPVTVPPPRSAWLSFWNAWLRPVLLVSLALFAFRSTILDWNVVPTGSMKPTIVEGDYILVNKLAFDVRVPFVGWRLLERASPQRGDIVVFEPPGERDRYVKRVLGVPGDIVELRDNHLYVNGQPAGYDFSAPTEPPPVGEDARLSPGVEVVSGHAHAVMLSPDDPGLTSFGPVIVPARHYFVLGDNRDNSKDSRTFGFVGRERLVGRVSRVLVSLDLANASLPRLDRFLYRLA